MPDISLKIQTLGAEPALRSAKEVQAVIQNMQKMSKKSPFGEMSTKQVAQAEKMLSKYNLTQSKAVKLAKELTSTMESYNKALAGSNVNLRTKAGRETVRNMGTLRDRALVGNIRDFTTRGEGLGGGGLAGGMAKGAGFGSMMAGGLLGSAAIMIGKGIVWGFKDANKQLRTASAIAGISRGSNSALIENITGFNYVGTNQADFAQRAAMLGHGADTKNKSMEALRNMVSAGATPTAKGLLDVMAMQQMGVDIGQSSGLVKTQVSGMNALLTGGKNQQPSDLVNFRKIMAEATTQGMSGVRSGEFIEGINQIAQATQRTANVVDVNKVGDVMAAAGRLGSPAWQGARGAQNLTGIYEAMQNPGAGVAGKMLMMQAGGFGTSTRSVLQAKMNLEAGLTPGNLGGLLRPLRGHGLAGYAALNQITNGAISMTQAKALMEGVRLTPGQKEGKVKPFTIEDFMNPQNQAAQAALGAAKSNEREQIDVLTELYKKGGAAAMADITKREMVATLMDPLNAIAAAVQKDIFGTDYSSPYTERVKKDNELARMTEARAKGSRTPAVVATSARGGDPADAAAVERGGTGQRWNTKDPYSVQNTPTPTSASAAPQIPVGGGKR
jgi:hypothetical protein